MELEKEKPRVALLSVASNTVLVIFKVVVGMATGSVSILSEAIHSGMDLMAAVIAFFAVRKSAKPADAEHPFGHAKVESISAAAEALLIFAAAAWIISEALSRFFVPRPVELLGWGIGVMLASSVVNVVVSHMLFRVGRRTESSALLADAWHLRTDVYTSAGVMLALAVIEVGERLVPAANLHWIDPAVAILVALFILRAAYQLTSGAVRDMLDTSFPADEQQWLNSYLTGLHPVVRSFHKVRTRKAGPARFIDMHVVVDSEMSVEESHRITEQITQEIQSRFKRTSVVVHVEPCDGSCGAACASGCLLSEEAQRAARQKRQEASLL
ncbi:MAG: cation diffusion facilitator family transporter [Planctomycetota bacterium]